MNDLDWMWPREVGKFVWMDRMTSLWIEADGKLRVPGSWGKLLIPCRYMRQSDFQVGWRVVEHRWDSDTFVLAKPWPIWAALRIGVGVRWLNDYAMYRAWRAGLLHHEPGIITRWRDLKLVRVFRR